MSVDRLRDLALQLMKLGVSQRGVQELLMFPPDIVERQIAYLPYRKAKRPEAFIIEAVRNNYSAPKEFFYASPKAQPSPSTHPLDSRTESFDPIAPADSFGHGTQDPSYIASPNSGMEPARSDDRRSLPQTNALDGP